MKNKKIYFWAITVSLGGFLFGMDTALISGVERTVQQLWQMSDVMTGQMVAMALYGTVIGALIGGMPAQYYGRKPTLFVIALIFLISAVGSALAVGPWSLMFFRFIGGLSVGASSVVAPMYIAEISPEEKRGRLTAMFQFNLVFGILIAYFSNWVIATDNPEAWRWMLGVESFPALLFAILVLMIPESPRWLLVKKGDEDEALRILGIIDPARAEILLEEIKKSTDRQKVAGIKELFTARYRFPLMLAFLLAFFNQVSGINAIIYYAPRIFESAGLAVSTALLSSVGIGVVNIVFTMLGLMLIDRMGRRFLMFVGSVGYIVSLALVTFVFATGYGQGTLLLPFLIFIFIAAHAVGQGAVIWVFISEIFPNRVRSWGTSFGSGTHWVFAALIAGNFPYVAGKLGQAPIFAFFAFMMVVQLVFVWRMMPETKGRSLEEIEGDMVKAQSSKAGVGS